MYYKLHPLITNDLLLMKIETSTEMINQSFFVLSFLAYMGLEQYSTVYKIWYNNITV